MKFSMEQLKNILPDYESELVINDSDSAFFSGVLMYEKDTETLQSGVLYVVHSEHISSLLKSPHTLNIVCLSESTGKPLSSVHNILYTEPAEKKAGRIIAAVCSFISSEAEIMKMRLKITEATYSQLGLKNLIRTGFEIFSNPFFISDLSLTVIGYSECEIEDTESFRWNNVINNYLPMPYEKVKILKSRGILDKVYKSEEAIVRSYEFNSQRSLAVRIAVKKNAVGHLVMYEYFRPFTETDFRLIGIFAQAVADEIQKMDSLVKSRGEADDYFLNDLLNGKYSQLSLEMIEDRMPVRRSLLKRSLYIFAAEPDAGIKKEVSEVYLKEALAAALGNKISTIYNNTIVILLDCDQFSYEEFRKKTENILAENGIYAGISGMFSDIRDCLMFYEQAKSAAVFGKKHMNRGHLYLYENSYIFDMFSRFPHSADLRNFINSKVSSMIEYDKKNKTSFTDSLYVYIFNSRDIAKCADIFGIHRNSMLYRIKKIQDIISIDFDDSEVCFSIFLSFKILIYYSEYIPAGSHAEHSQHEKNE